MSDQDRIKLAKAMGWEYEKPYGTNAGPLFGKLPAGGGVWTRSDGSFTNRFDPFTDANDDYAVLEWMRNMAKGSPEKYRLDFYAHSMRGSMCWNYQIGDYARAALKVLQDKDDGN